MPEGDTVFHTAQVLQTALAGRQLTGVDFRVPRLATADLTGWTGRSQGVSASHEIIMGLY